jgi:hypothetical protein
MPRTLIEQHKWSRGPRSLHGSNLHLIAFQLPAELPATCSERVRASSRRVRLITEVQTDSVWQNTGKDSAESYLWSHCVATGRTLYIKTGVFVCYPKRKISDDYMP